MLSRAGTSKPGLKRDLGSTDESVWPLFKADMGNPTRARLREGTGGPGCKRSKTNAELPNLAMPTASGLEPALTDALAEVGASDWEESDTKMAGPTRVVLRVEAGKSRVEQSAAGRMGPNLITPNEGTESSAWA